MPAVKRPRGSGGSGESSSSQAPVQRSGQAGPQPVHAQPSSQLGIQNQAQAVQQPAYRTSPGPYIPPHLHAQAVQQPTQQPPFITPGQLTQTQQQPTLYSLGQQFFTPIYTALGSLMPQGYQLPYGYQPPQPSGHPQIQAGTGYPQPTQLVPYSQGYPQPTQLVSYSQPNIQAGPGQAQTALIGGASYYHPQCQACTGQVAPPMHSQALAQAAASLQAPPQSTFQQQGAQVRPTGYQPGQAAAGILLMAQIQATQLQAGALVQGQAQLQSQPVTTQTPQPQPQSQAVARSAQPVTAGGGQRVTQGVAGSSAGAGTPTAAGADDDDVVVTSYRLGAMADFPHMRSMCATLRFNDTPHASTCPNCFCLVCDKLAPCGALWGDGDNPDDHCNAHDSDPVWQARRVAARNVRNAATGSNAGVPTNSHASSSSAVMAAGLVASSSDANPLGNVQQSAAEPKPNIQAGSMLPGGRPSGQFVNANGQEYLDDMGPEDDRELLALLEGLEQAEQASTELEPPAGALRVTLHPYQKRALSWMVAHENSEHHVCGGILADEQGLGKTVQMLALIVTRQPSRKNAESALKQARRELYVQVYHALGRSARDQRAADEAARLNAAARGGSSGSSEEAGSSPAVGGGEPLGKKKSAKKPSSRPWTPCGRPGCTCTMCNKAKEHQEKAARKEAERQYKMEQEARKRAKLAAKACGSSAASIPLGVSPLTPTVESPDGGIAKRTLVVCPLCVASQWMDEIEAKTPQLSSVLYHGPTRQQRFPPTLLASHDIVVTTYDVLHSEHNMSPVGGLFRLPWFRVILDEAHIIRNTSTQAARAAIALQADNRWCLTGTPIVNSCNDIFSLFCFLRYAPFCNRVNFNASIRNRLQGTRGRHAPSVSARREGMKQLRLALSAVTLRRHKSDKEADGRPIIVLPPKTVRVVQCAFSPEERDFYESMEKRTQAQFNKYVREGWAQNYAHILVLLLRLRQACIHPWLAQRKDDGLPAEGDEKKHAAGLDSELKEKLLDKFSAPDRGECPICMDVAQAPVVTSCAHGPFCLECITQNLQHQDNQSAQGSCPLCRAALNPSLLFSKADLLPFRPPTPEPIDLEEELKPFVSSTKLDHVVTVLDKIRAEDDNHNRMHEGELGFEQQVTKTCLFSQFTGALDMLQQPLHDAGIPYLRLDGRMNLAQRAEAVRAFARDPSIRVLLCSIKAAALGLNLSCACRTILLDCWWNGATEDQAIDRCHRLGQTREVNVTKIVMDLGEPGRETVEQRIIIMQDEKRAVAEAALGADENAATGARTRLSLQELRQLFGLSSRRRGAGAAGGSGNQDVGGGSGNQDGAGGSGGFGAAADDMIQPQDVMG